MHHRAVKDGDVAEEGDASLEPGQTARRSTRSEDAPTTASMSLEHLASPRATALCPGGVAWSIGREEQNLERKIMGRLSKPDPSSPADPD
ncbi:hypothetical protein NL676_012939 [Syzygium grande]|nr:hypothetical protein NL676_012939 [Syzygium grande]